MFEMESKWLRSWTYVFCLLLLAAASGWKWHHFAMFPPLETWSMLFGYFAFFLIGATLLIGPLCTWLPARWAPTLLSIRRDVGIFAGLTGLLHVALVLVLFQGEPRLLIISDSQAPKADGWLGLFFLSSAENGSWEWPVPNWSLAGVANYLGACALLILFVLWVSSYLPAKKWLGTAAWKRLHLSNPLLFLLVLFHGLIYVQTIKGEPHSFADLLWLAVLVWLARSLSFLTAILRRKR